jgi:hypothetical protein
MRPDVEPPERDDIDLLLSQLDHPLPSVSVHDIVTRARKPVRQWRRVAMVFLPLAVAGAAYAMPGSPLPRWIGDLRARLSSSEVNSPTGPVSPIRPEPQAGPGIAVSPGRSLVIQFTHAQAAGEARATLVDDAVLAVQSSNAGPGFTSDSDRLVIRNAGSTASYEIRIPRDAARIEIRIAGQRVLLKDGNQVTASGTTESAESWRIPLQNADP